jgi:hypothetical protein
MSAVLSTVSLDMGEVHNLSLILIEVLEDNNVPVNLATAAVALTLSRVANHGVTLSMEREMKNTQDLIAVAQIGAEERVH